MKPDGYVVDRLRIRRQLLSSQENIVDTDPPKFPVLSRVGKSTCPICGASVASMKVLSFVSHWYGSIFKCDAEYHDHDADVIDSGSKVVVSCPKSVGV